MTIFHPFGSGTYTLNSSISSTATSITLSSFTEPVSGTPYTMALLNTDIAYGTISPKTSKSEFISFTGITQNVDGTATLTGVTRGLAKKYPFTTSATFKLPHSGQDIFIISNSPQLYEKYPAKENDEHITGQWTFDYFPITPSNSDASTTVKGVTKLSVAPASANDPIAAGTNDGRIPTQGENDALVGNNTDIAVGTGNKFVTQTGLQHNAEKYAVDTSGSSTAYVAVLSPLATSLTDGMVIYVKLVNANTTTTPTLTLTGTDTAKTIVKGTNTALAVGDIGANSYNTLIYDGTNLVLQNPVSTAVSTSGTYYKTGATTVTTVGSSKVIAHGLGTTPRFVKITAQSSTGTATVSVISVGTYDVTGTNQQCVYTSNNGDDTNIDATHILFISSNTGSGTSTAGTCSVDATNITLAFTNSNGGKVFSLLWEVSLL